MVPGQATQDLSRQAAQRRGLPARLFSRYLRSIVLLEERKDALQLLGRRLGAILTDFKSLGTLDSLTLLLAELGDQLGPESLGQPTIPLLRTLTGPGQPLLLVLRHRVKIAEKPRVPFVEL